MFSTNQAADASDRQARTVGPSTVQSRLIGPFTATAPQAAHSRTVAVIDGVGLATIGRHDEERAWRNTNPGQIVLVPRYWLSPAATHHHHMLDLFPKDWILV